jgi:hypothetical protein
VKAKLQWIIQKGRDTTNMKYLLKETEVNEESQTERVTIWASSSMVIDLGLPRS